MGPADSDRFPVGSRRGPCDFGALMEPSAHSYLGTWHPALVLGYAVAVVGLTVLVISPVYAGLSLAGALGLCVASRGRGAVPLVAGALGLAALVAVLNPLFNTAGATVLFTWLGRPYTAEALAFGAVMGAMLAAALLWFAGIGPALGSEKVTYLFGSAAPALCTVLTLVMGLVPAYGRRAAALAEARAGIGHDPLAAPGLGTKVRGGATVLGALTAWSLDRGVATADAMAARGFGTGRRTTWGRYHFTARDGMLAAALAGLLAVTVVGLIGGAGQTEFLPHIVLAAPSPLAVASWTAWGLFVALPALGTVEEEVRWHCSLRNI